MVLIAVLNSEDLEKIVFPIENPRFFMEDRMHSVNYNCQKVHIVKQAVDSKVCIYFCDLPTSNLLNTVNSAHLVLQ